MLSIREKDEDIILTCCICFSNKNIGGLKCGHLMCYQRVNHMSDQHMTNNITCPICRKKCYKDHILKIFCN